MPRPLASGGERVPGPGAGRSPGPPPRGLSGPSPELLVLVGPTGTGKTEVALRVAEAVGAEIVACDATQVYRGLDAATGKPGAAERMRVPHHLIDVVEPDVPFNLGAYVRMAEAAVAAVHGRGAVPLVVGGTGMYLRGLLRGVVSAPPADPALRARVRALVARAGPERTHRCLARLDPRSARRLPPGDLQRVSRALEAALAGGRTWGVALDAEGTWASGRERYPAVKVGLDLDRTEHAARLHARVAAFFDAGLVEEVAGLLARGVPPDANALRAIGYREVVAALREGTDPRAAADRVRVATRRYAKRQRTWFGGEPGIAWIDAGREPARVAEDVVWLWKDARR